MTRADPGRYAPPPVPNVHVVWHREYALSATELEALLGQFGDLLPTPLRQRVDLPGYAAKLLRHAEVALARVANETVGLLAIYANDTVSRRGHVPVVAVLPSLRGLGVGRQLLVAAIDLAARHGMEVIDLEVAVDNARAQAAYAAVGFSAVPSTGDMLRMECRL